MALIELNYLSTTIGKHQTLNVILPEDESFFKKDEEANPLKSMLVLHGLSSDTHSYKRYTSIERYANEHQLAIIMPDADHSFYTNMAYGHSYYDYVMEVYDYVHQIFPLSKDRADNFIAGHSMGGFGTTKFAFTQSERFAKAGILSAPFDVTMLKDYEYYDFSPASILGENKDVKGTDFDPYHLVDQAVNNKQDLPELLIMCGTEDELYQDNLDFIKYLDDKGINYDFRESPGKHDYAYWDKAIKEVIETFTQN
ncbi:esterase family protein [Staphylococcus pragensis]|uniref:Esterase family protein n=1 Tax=Staphylococcus pragensis TaxID=1611836 RepID=A0A4Z1C3S0_9STAP|nr:MULTISPECIES: alpha/beta hydrolase family protein [Staphylococcus]RTX91940.1 esterase family protein [Staphylococcus carnosus]TGN26981.1 esterase family protein [Staphylococcus pragensis]GGG94328.1 tributyrin esterase [Staphylococcus pragensis]